MLIVTDFEFNQAFDFVNNTSIDPIPECRFEIIQIGAVKLDENYNIVGRFSEFIKPNLYKTLHPFVKKITCFESEQFKDALPFNEVYENFRKFMGDEPVFVTWGKADVQTLYTNLKYYDMLQCKVLIKYIDLQSIVSSKLNFKKGVIGLKNAVEMLNIEETEPFHNAYNDAYYTAMILKKISHNNIKVNIFNPSHIKQKKTSVKPVTGIVKTRRKKSNRTKSSIKIEI